MPEIVEKREFLRRLGRAENDYPLNRCTGEGRVSNFNLLRTAAAAGHESILLICPPHRNIQGNLFL
jgi:hypothetical protein